MNDWRGKKFDKLAKKERVARSKEGNNRKQKLEDYFESAEQDWEKFLEATDKNYFKARVVEVHKKYAFVSPEDTIGTINTRDVWLATIAKKYLQSTRVERNFVSVGDRVLCLKDDTIKLEKEDDLPACSIESRAPRTSTISRTDPLLEKRIHVLATNMTQLVIVASYCSPRIKWGLIDRYLLLAEEGNLKVTIILNKKDLLLEEKESFIEECAARQKVYEDLGYNVLSIQATKLKKGSEDREKIKNVFKGEISLVSGHSGVGKSSLVNLMRPEINQEVESNEIFTKGRHTTSYASLIKLGIGGYVIDTPGIRSFVLMKQTPFELSLGFREFREFMHQCRYRGCRHVDEPECAILKALEEGKISSERHKSYVGILLGTTGREGRMRDQQKSNYTKET